jgi:hypothetical protein
MAEPVTAVAGVVILALQDLLEQAVVVEEPLL